MLYWDGVCFIVDAVICRQEPNFIELLKHTHKCLAQKRANHNKVTSQTATSHVEFVTGIMLISAKQYSLSNIFCLSSSMKLGRDVGARSNEFSRCCLRRRLLFGSSQKGREIRQRHPRILK